MNSFFLHEAVLIIVGVVLWQLEQQIFYKRLTLKDRLNEVGRSLKYVFFIVIIDDEIVEFIEEHYDIVVILESEHYIAAGLFIDFIRTFLNNYVFKKAK